MTKDEILALSIADLNFPVHTANWGADMARETWRDTPRPASPTARLQLLKRIAVREVLDALPPYAESEAYRKKYLYTPSVHEVRFFEKLGELGLTRLDCLYLPQWTVTLEVLRSLPREELLEKPAILLGTLTSAAIDHIWGNTRSELTVRTLLAFPDRSEWKVRCLLENCKTSITKTRTLLRKLGFNYEDGTFMRMGTARKHAEDLAARREIGMRTAMTVVRIARKEGWIRVVD